MRERPQIAAAPRGAVSHSRSPSPESVGRSLGRVALIVVVPFVVLVGLWAAFAFLRDDDANRLLVVGVAIVVGVGGVFVLFWAMDRVVDFLPEARRERVRPYVFVGPALVILGVFLIYPVINTILISFKDARSRSSSASTTTSSCSPTRACCGRCATRWAGSCWSRSSR